MVGMERVHRYIKEEGSNIFSVEAENKEETRDFHLLLEESNGRS